jgi:transposase
MLGVDCQVVAPTLVPVKAGDRVKTDRRDAEKLARCHRAGDRSAVWVPDEAHEALRDLVRAREAAKKDQLRTRHRLSKFLLRHGRRQPDGMKAWTKQYLEWVKTHVHFDQPALEAALLDYFHEVEPVAERIERLEKSLDEAISQAPAQIRAVIEALQALRGVAQLTAATIVSEIGSFSRFEPRKLMGYSGLVASEHSSGSKIKRLHHKDRQCAPAKSHRGSGLGIPAPTVDRRLPAPTTAQSEPQRGSESHRVESPVSTAQTIYKTHRGR